MLNFIVNLEVPSPNSQRSTYRDAHAVPSIFRRCGAKPREQRFRSSSFAKKTNVEVRDITIRRTIDNIYKRERNTHAAGDIFTFFYLFVNLFSSPFHQTCTGDKKKKPRTTIIYNRCSWFVLFVPCTRLMKRGRKLVHEKIKKRKDVTCCVCVSLSLSFLISKKIVQHLQDIFKSSCQFP